MQKQDYGALLQDTILFKGVDATVLEAIIENPDAALVSFTAGEPVYDRALHRNRIGILCKGRAQVSMDAVDTHRVILKYLLPGQLLGVAALFLEGDEYVSRIEAREPTEVLFLERRLVLSLFAMDTQFAENYIRYLSGRIVFLNRKIEELLGYSAESRLINHLQNNAKPLENGAGELTVKSVAELAKVLSVGRASLYRALSALEEDGRILREGKRIHVPSMRGLVP